MGILNSPAHSPLIDQEPERQFDPGTRMMSRQWAHMWIYYNQQASLPCAPEIKSSQTLLLLHGIFLLGALQFVLQKQISFHEFHFHRGIRDCFLLVQTLVGPCPTELCWRKALSRFVSAQSKGMAGWLCPWLALLTTCALTSDQGSFLPFKQWCWSSNAISVKSRFPISYPSF